MFTPSMYCGQPSFRTHFRFSYLFFFHSLCAFRILRRRHHHYHGGGILQLLLFFWFACFTLCMSHVYICLLSCCSCDCGFVVYVLVVSRFELSCYSFVFQFPLPCREYSSCFNALRIIIFFFSIFRTLHVFLPLLIVTVVLA